MSERPLAGRTVIDLTNALAGPYATLLLGGLGARVIKVENPLLGGDPSRNNSPYVGPEGLSLTRETAGDMSVSMVLRGRNKLSVTLNLKHADARSVFADLIAEADILVENFSAGVTGRLGIDYEFARTVNPRLVYTSISGFGAHGGYGSGKAMDTIVQALSGVMMTAGAPGEPPVRFGFPVADLVTPLFGVIGTLAALLQAEQTGTGQHVDVSMLGTLTSMLACEPYDALEAVGMQLRTGTTVPRLAPFGIFEASDGWFALCAPSDAFAHGVFAAMGRPELGEDERFRTRDVRVANADELHAEIADWAVSRPLASLLDDFSAQGVPAAEVREPSVAVRDPLVLSRSEVVALAHPDFPATSDLYGTGVPITFSDADVSLDRPAPRLGEHNTDVYGGMLGYSRERIEAMAQDGVI